MVIRVIRVPVVEQAPVLLWGLVEPMGIPVVEEEEKRLILVLLDPWNRVRVDLIARALTATRWTVLPERHPWLAAYW